MKTIIALLIISGAVAVSSACGEEPVEFWDAILKTAVENALGITDPTPSDMLGLNELVCTNTVDNGITDLTGLQCAANLQTLVLSYNQIGDILPLYGLSQLQTLLLNDNQISDISPLLGLRRLETLSLSFNELNEEAYCSHLETIICDNNPGVSLDYEPNPNPPTGILASCGTYPDRVHVTWTRVCNGPLYTSYYRVYRAPSMDGTKTPISQWQTPLSFDDRTANPETRYVYWIQAALSSQGLRAGDCGAPSMGWLLSKPKLTVSSTAGGSVTTPGQGTYTYRVGETVNVEAEPWDANLYVFWGWTGTAVDAGRVADAKRVSTTVTVDNDYTLKAHFVTALNTICVDDDAKGDPRPGDPGVGDPNENGRPDHPFDSIQEAIEVAANNASIVVLPGTYCENVDLLGKRIHLIGFDPYDPEKINPYPVIAGVGPGPIVRFASGEDPDCTMRGFVITRAKGPLGCAIYCSGSSPTLDHCLIVGNRSAQPYPAAVYCKDSSAVFTHCTIADNDGGQYGAGLYLVDSNVVLANSIVWGNTTKQILLDGTSKPSITYTDIAGWWPGPSNIHTNPLFVRAGYWTDPSDPTVVLGPRNSKAVWINGDYHLKSRTGRWDQKTLNWVQDNASSPCIDAGDPASLVGNEPLPNGGIINLGVYGGTAQASKSPLLEQSVDFQDAFLKAAVEEALGIQDPTPTDMLGLTDFVCSNTVNDGIKDLTGLQCAANLQALVLSYNQISDLWPLSRLDQLQTLLLNDNRINDISALSGLSQLRYLNLHRNQISEISALAGLNNLQVLSLYLNQVSDISSLSGLTGLHSLDLQQNEVSDISVLGGLSRLQALFLRQNHVSDISALSGLTGLHSLDLSYNRLNNDAYCSHLQILMANNNGINLSYDSNRNPPTGVSVSPDPYECKVKVIWDAVCNGPMYTSYYRVSRGTSVDGVKIPISQWQTASSFDDVTAQPGTLYIYWVHTATSSQGLDAGDYSTGRWMGTPLP